MSAPIVKYETSKFGRVPILRVECERETEQSVFVINPKYPNIKPSRQAKISSYSQYHDTWADAHAHLLAMAEASVAACRRSLELANAKLGNIKGMKPPEVDQ